MTRTVRIGISLATAVLLTALPSAAQVQDALGIQVVSSRPETVTGGDALVRIDVPGGVAVASVRVALNGADVTATLRPSATGQSLSGVVTGLRPGRNVLSATANGSTRQAQLTLVNFPITGPVISGPHEQPFVCETENFKLRSGGTLGAPRDANCSVTTRVDYLYRTTAGGELKPLADRSVRPVDVATVTTRSGATIPYIVRIETGTINRAIYQIAMLDDRAGWNERLIYTFGGGCVTGWYRQGRTTGGVEDDVMLRQGYAVASATLNVAGNNCNELIAAETMMMVKERFIEGYGAPLFTIGMGSSGGSYQTHQIGDNYPGLLDGVISGRSFPDLIFGTVPYATDSRLLARYFETTPLQYTDEQKKKVTGFMLLGTLAENSESGRRIDPTAQCPEVLPAALRYDPVNNRTGARCDVYSHAVNVYGRDPQTGYARRPLDNVGVQYGLVALRNGVITKEQFLDLNERIGGFDQDGKMVRTRSKADPDAIVSGYRSGRLTNGGLGLSSIPMIDYRGYMDDNPGGDVHMRYHSFSTRERLRKANGHIDNHVMLTEDNRYGGFSTRSPVLRDAIRQMDEWLTSMRNMPGPAGIAKIRQAKPADLVDACWTRDATPRKIAEPQVMGTGECETLYPSNSFPRGVAGAPVAADIVKCQLTPIKASDYNVQFTSDDLARLKALFPAGVCDWSKPGVGQQKPAGVWQTFGKPPAELSTR